jgi:Xaa-Pro dipeptidase
MNADIIDRCRAAMEAEDLDGLVAMSPENFAYVTGFIVPSQPVLRWRHAAVVLTRDGREALYTVDMEAATVRSLAP